MLSAEVTQIIFHINEVFTDWALSQSILAPAIMNTAELSYRLTFLDSLTLANPRVEYIHHICARLDLSHSRGVCRETGVHKSTTSHLMKLPISLQSKLGLTYCTSLGES